MTENTYDWGISQLEVAPSEDGLADVVKTVHWTLSATQDDLSASCYGSVGMDAPDAGAFTPYTELTKADVVAWLEAKLDGDQLRTALAEQIQAQRTPAIITPPLPWA